MQQYQHTGTPTPTADGTRSPVHLDSHRAASSRLYSNEVAAMSCAESDESIRGLPEMNDDRSHGCSQHEQCDILQHERAGPSTAIQEKPTCGATKQKLEEDDNNDTERQQSRICVLKPRAGCSSVSEAGGHGPTKLRNSPTERRALPKWTFANCTAIDIFPMSYDFEPLSMHSDTHGVWVLVYSKAGALRIIRCSPKSGSRQSDLTVSAKELMEPWETKAVLHINGGAKLPKRPQGEIGFVRVGDESLLLVGEAESLASKQATRLAVYSIGCRDESHCDNTAVEVEFEHLTRWPVGQGTAAPRPRSYYSITADEQSQSFLLFAGAAAAGCHEGEEASGPLEEFLPSSWDIFDDLWSFSKLSRQWHRLFIIASTEEDGLATNECPTLPWPPARAGHSAAVWGGYMWAFGGYTKRIKGAGCSENGVAVDDLWCWDIEGNSWRQIRPVGKAPAPRYRHASSFVSGLLLIYGGAAADGPVAPEETLYAANVADLRTAVWTRVTILDALPPTQFFLGSAACYSNHDKIDKELFFIYGKSDAFLISENVLESIDNGCSARSCEETPVGAHTQERGASDQGTYRRQRLDTPGKPCLPREFRLSSVPPVERGARSSILRASTEDPIARGDESLRNSGLEGEPRICNPIGLQILVTPMVRSAQPALTAAGAGTAVRVREPRKDLFTANQKAHWKPCPPLRSSVAPVVFRPRCRVQRCPGQDKGQLQGPCAALVQKPHRQMASGYPPKASTAVLQQANPAVYPPRREIQGSTMLRSQSHTTETWAAPERMRQQSLRAIDQQKQQVTERYAGNSLSAKRSAHLEAPMPLLQHLSFRSPAPHDAASRSARSIMGDSVMHDCLTFGTANVTRASFSGRRWRPLALSSACAARRSFSGMPLRVPIENYAQLPPVKTKASPAQSQASCIAFTEQTGLSEPRPAVVTGEQPLGINSVKGENSRLVVGPTVPPGAAATAVAVAAAPATTTTTVTAATTAPAAPADEASKHKFYPLGTLSSNQIADEASSPVHSNYTVQQSGPRRVDGLTALMFWATSTSSAYRRSSTENATVGGSTRENSNSSVSQFTSQGNSSSQTIADTNNGNRDSEATCTQRSIDGDFACQGTRRSSLPPLSTTSRLYHSPQSQEQRLAAMFYSSQLSAASAPAQRCSAERASLPPLPYSVSMKPPAAADAPKSMVARRVAAHAFVAEPTGLTGDEGLSFPRPARKVKASSSTKMRRSGTNSKPKAKTSAEGSGKEKHRDAHSAKAMPRQSSSNSRQPLRATAAAIRRASKRAASQQQAAASTAGRVTSLMPTRKVSREGNSHTQVGYCVTKIKPALQGPRRSSTIPRMASPLAPLEDSLLRRMVGWPPEAIAAVLVHKVNMSLEPMQRRRLSSVKHKSTQKG
ncbi:hypothetical protein, conserved [Eimeria necatrix]|uniref:Kelch motif domain-containing protein n=1 Tax=Eimeria necatrix TaxID=51315 RepID=U6MKG1_9EIME|nr:hypothetical protein, conserved [Eimeria necatrix]CDJ62130.1 hypothetical protein, conserved [Eimeria necatrix]